MDDGMLLVGFFVAIILGILVGADASRRFGPGAGIAWGVCTFLLAIVTLPLYLLRVITQSTPPASLPARVCPRCGLTTQALSTKFCGGCGKNFQE